MLPPPPQPRQRQHGPAAGRINLNIVDAVSSANWRGFTVGNDTRTTFAANFVPKLGSASAIASSAPTDSTGAGRRGPPGPSLPTARNVARPASVTDEAPSAARS